MSDWEFFRSEIVESAYSEIEQSPAEISDELIEFFPLDFEARFPAEKWGDFFTSHDFVYTSRYGVPMSNDVDASCCAYQCKHCLAMIWEYVAEEDPLPEDTIESFDPDDYCPSQYSHPFGAKDMERFKNKQGQILMDEVSNLTPKNTWPCPEFDPNRKRRVFPRPVIDGDQLLNAPHCIMSGDKDETI